MKNVELNVHNFHFPFLDQERAQIIKQLQNGQVPSVDMDNVVEFLETQIQKFLEISPDSTYTELIVRRFNTLFKVYL